MSRIQVLCIPKVGEHAEAELVADIPDSEAITELLLVRVGTQETPATNEDIRDVANQIAQILGSKDPDSEHSLGMLIGHHGIEIERIKLGDD